MLPCCKKSKSMVTLVDSDAGWYAIFLYTYTRGRAVANCASRYAIKKEAEATNKPLIVAFSASWCGPCKRVYPHFEALSKEDAHQHALFAKVDVESAVQVAAEAGIEALPTFHAYHGSVLLEEVRCSVFF